MSGPHVVLENGRVTLCVAEKGAEMQSLRLDGAEYLWQGGPGFWAGRAPNLFPYVARLSEKTYTYRGKPYHLDIHGFVKDSCLRVIRQGKAHVSFQLLPDERMLAQYPFPHEYRVHYRLFAAGVSIRYEVRNTGKQTMYFGIGGHPGFAVPLNEGCSFQDYCLDFLQPCTPARIHFSDEAFVTGEGPYPLEGGQLLPLRHALFDNDAIVLRETPGAVLLKGPKNGRWIRMSYPAFPYLGLWHTNRSEAPFLCIEPWSSLPSRQGVVEELTEQRDLIALEEGDVYENEWTITLGG